MSRHAKDPRTDASRAGEEFDDLFRTSTQRAEEKRAAGRYPYDLPEVVR
ncbi:hypothetical protein [Streptomyces sp. SID5910]|nr:hypothetical protein [Streptomyces sp. SID5910]MYR43090.1 hypothetical protein [Streptomyces sp. SID5910]